MDISAGVLVREGNIIRRGPRQVNKSVVLSILHEKKYIRYYIGHKKNPCMISQKMPDYKLSVCNNAGYGKSQKLNVKS